MLDTKEKRDEYRAAKKAERQEKSDDATANAKAKAADAKAKRIAARTAATEKCDAAYADMKEEWSKIGPTRERNKKARQDARDAAKSEKATRKAERKAARSAVTNQGGN